MDETTAYRRTDDSIQNNLASATTMASSKTFTITTVHKGGERVSVSIVIQRKVSVPNEA